MLKSIATISTFFLLFSSTTMLAQDTLTVFMADQFVADETQVTVPFSVTHFDSISYFSFSIDWDTTRLAFNSISYAEDSGLLESEYSASINPDTIGLQWIDGGALYSSVIDSAIIFSLTLDIISDNREALKINFGNNPTSIEAGDVNGSEIPLKSVGANITFEQQSTSIQLVLETEGIYVGQNTPNPFSDETLISFEISKSEEVLFEVYDLEGRSIIRNKSQFPKGDNFIKLNKLQLNGSGVYQYSLSIKQKTITKKLILLN